MDVLEEKKQYELGLLLKDEDYSPITRLIQKYVSSSVSEGSLVKVNLAYAIKKNSQAFFGYLKFEMEPEKVGDLGKDLKHESSVIRHLLIKLPFNITKEIPQARPSLKPELKRKEPKPAASVLTNEALEKKIEEILQ